MAPGPLLVDRARRFPEPVEAELARRRLEMTGRQRGRVLDLDDPAARDEVAETVDLEAVEPRYDTVVTIAQLVRFPDLDAAVHALDRLLAPGGTLLAVEPIARPGLLEVVADTAWALHPSVVGFHLCRDLPATLRTTTLVMDDLERFTMPTPIAPLHHFVALSARRARPATRPAGGDGR